MNKKPNVGFRIPGHPLQRPGQTAQFKPGVAQPKLQPTPGVLQPKSPPVPPHRPTAVPFGSVIQEVRKKTTKKKPVQRKAVVTLTVGANSYNGVSSGQYGHAEM